MPLEVKGVAPLLHVLNMRVALRFYRDVLGFSVTGVSPASADPDHANRCTLQLNGATIFLNIAGDPENKPAPPEPFPWPTHQDTRVYFACPNLDGAYEFLRSRGLEPDPPDVAYHGMKQIFITDPDGYGLCFQWKA